MSEAGEERRARKRDEVGRESGAPIESRLHTRLLVAPSLARSQFRQMHSTLQNWAKEKALGCVNSPLTARGSQEAGFMKPRAHSFAPHCMLYVRSFVRSYLHFFVVSSFSHLRTT